MFSKFGYCKFKEGCKRKHYSEICQQNQTCQSTKNCPKRHPKECKKNKTEKGCQFVSGCSYKHSSDHAASKDCETKYEVELNEKVNQLENTVAELSNKVEGMKADKFEQLDKVVRALVWKVLSLELEEVN